MPTPHHARLDRRAPGRAAAVRLGALAACCIVLAWMIQRALGAAEFGGHPDEGAHFVSGVMARDYLFGGAPAPPLEFALSYYAHYPAVAIGNWPPAFYAVEAVWLGLWGASRTAALALVGVSGGLLAAGAGGVAVGRVGWVAGLWAGAMLLVLPPVGTQLTLVSPELLVCALMVLAAILFARLIDAPSARGGIVAGAVAGAAMLVKGNAFALALVPPLLIALNRRWRVVRAPGLWLSAVVAALLAGPWYAVTMDYARAGWEGPVGWGFTSRAVPYFARELMTALGWPLAAVASVGAVRAARAWRARTIAEQAVLVLGLASFAFHTLVPASLEGRFMISVLPACVLLVAEGGRWLAARAAAAARRPALERPLILAGAAVALVGTAARLRPVAPSGIGPAAEAAMAIAGDRPSAVLVSSLHAQEVAFVAEFAMRDARRPRHYVLRAIKAMARSDFSGRRYEQTITSVPELRAQLDSVPVRVIVIDTAPGGFRFGHHPLLRRMVESAPEHWEPVPLSRRAGERFVVFRRRGLAPDRAPKVEVTVKGYKATSWASPPRAP